MPVSVAARLGAWAERHGQPLTWWTLLRSWWTLPASNLGTLDSIDSVVAHLSLANRLYLEGYPQLALAVIRAARLWLAQQSDTPESALDPTTLAGVLDSSAQSLEEEMNQMWTNWEDQLQPIFEANYSAAHRGMIMANRFGTFNEGTVRVDNRATTFHQRSAALASLSARFHDVLQETAPERRRLGASHIAALSWAILAAWSSSHRSEIIASRSALEAVLSAHEAELRQAGAPGREDLWRVLAAQCLVNDVNAPLTLALLSTPERAQTILPWLDETQRRRTVRQLVQATTEGNDLQVVQHLANYPALGKIFDQEAPIWTTQKGAKPVLDFRNNAARLQKYRHVVPEARHRPRYLFALIEAIFKKTKDAFLKGDVDQSLKLLGPLVPSANPAPKRDSLLDWIMRLASAPLDDDSLESPLARKILKDAEDLYAQLLRFAALWSLTELGRELKVPLVAIKHLIAYYQGYDDPMFKEAAVARLEVKVTQTKAIIRRFKRLDLYLPLTRFLDYFRLGQPPDERLIHLNVMQRYKKHANILPFKWHLGMINESLLVKQPTLAFHMMAHPELPEEIWDHVLAYPRPERYLILLGGLYRPDVRTRMRQALISHLRVEQGLRLLDELEELYLTDKGDVWQAGPNFRAQLGELLMDLRQHYDQTSAAPLHRGPGFKLPPKATIGMNHSGPVAIWFGGKRWILRAYKGRRWMSSPKGYLPLDAKQEQGLKYKGKLGITVTVGSGSQISFRNSTRKMNANIIVLEPLDSQKSDERTIKHNLQELQSHIRKFSHDAQAEDKNHTRRMRIHLGPEGWISSIHAAEFFPAIEKEPIPPQKEVWMDGPLEDGHRIVYATWRVNPHESVLDLESLCWSLQKSDGKWYEVPSPSPDYPHNLIVARMRFTQRTESTDPRSGPGILPFWKPLRALARALGYEWEADTRWIPFMEEAGAIVHLLFFLTTGSMRHPDFIRRALHYRQARGEASARAHRLEPGSLQWRSAAFYRRLVVRTVIGRISGSGIIAGLRQGFQDAFRMHSTRNQKDYLVAHAS